MTEKKCDGCGIAFPLDVLTLSNEEWYCWGCLGEFDEKDVD